MAGNTEPTYGDKELRAELTFAEGYRNAIYDDATGLSVKRGQTIKGNLSIGIGHNLMVAMPPEIIDWLYNYDVKNVCAQLDRGMPWWRNQPASVQRVLINMTFNLGYEKFTTFNVFLDYVKNGQYKQAIADLRGTLWARQVPRRLAQVTALLSAAISV